MEPELAPEAVESMQAAPVAGAGSEKEREKSELLERMAENEEIGEVLVVEEEPVAETPTLESDPAADEAAEVAERKQAHESVAREFPDALTEGTELFEACQEEMAYLLDANSPLASDPQAELKIARRMARVLGYAKRAAVAQATPAPAKPATPPPRRSVRPMPTGGAPVESPVTTLERRVSGAKSTGEMLELMREIGTPFEALLKR
ncbi:MAG: hypothetical protein WCO68_02150 [Verrucomicrobiota bacterium]